MYQRILTSSLMALMSLWGTVSTYAADVKGAKSCGVQSNISVVNDDLALQKYKEYVQYKDGAYVFRLSSGRSKRFPVGLDDSAGARYLLVDHLKSAGFFVLTYFYPNSEFSDHLTLLDDKYGGRYEVDGMPLFAEGCTRFITVDVCDFGCNGRVAIWDKRGDFWREVWAFAPYEYWIGADARWVTKDEVVVTKEVYRTQGQSTSGTIKRSFRVKLEIEGWKVHEVTVGSLQ